MRSAFDRREVDVGPADDSSGGTSGSVAPARTCIRQFLHERHLTHGAQRLGTFGEVLGPDLDKDGGADVMAAVNVGRQVRQQVLLIGRRLRPVHPEVVVGVADRQVGLPCRLQSLGQPCSVSKGHSQSSIFRGGGPTEPNRRPLPGGSPTSMVRSFWVDRSPWHPPRDAGAHAIVPGSSRVSPMHWRRFARL